MNYTMCSPELRQFIWEMWVYMVGCDLEEIQTPGELIQLPNSSHIDLVRALRQSLTFQ